jgi:hypothetical protein
LNNNPTGREIACIECAYLNIGKIGYDLGDFSYAKTQLQIAKKNTTFDGVQFFEKYEYSYPNSIGIHY